MSNKLNTTALILGGGGARAAYQVGVLKAVAEILGEEAINPFPIICGTSAGSINAAALAAGSDNFKNSVSAILHIWQNFQLHHVFKADSLSLLKRILIWAWRHLSFGDANKGPHSILDNQPLAKLLANNIDFKKLNTLDKAHIQHCCITACNYCTGVSTSFFTTNTGNKEWQKQQTIGVHSQLKVEHLLASSAIPAIFPSVKIEHSYFGDGSMRQTRPISPALHLGAKKLFIIGLRFKEAEAHKKINRRPSLGGTVGFILDSLFLNNLDADIENMEIINNLASKDATQVQKIEHLLINPSQDIADIALKHFNQLPRGFRLALTFLGMRKKTSRRFISYLMFIQSFCKELIDLGYGDAMQKEHEIRSFLLQ